MIVPEFDQDEMSGHVHTFDSEFVVWSGDVRYHAPAPAMALVNPRPIGFGRDDPWYIPVYVDMSAV